MAAEDDVRQASDRFCAALNRMLSGDAGPMAEVWSHGSAGLLGTIGHEVGAGLLTETSSRAGREVVDVGRVTPR